MEKLFIEATDDRPAVLIDPDKPLVKISGSSFPENAVPTYSIVINWLRTNGDKLKKRLICEFHFDYINSASKKSVYEMLLVLESLKMKGVDIIVNWNYDIFDEDMLDMGREFLDMTGIPYTLIPHEA